MPYTFQSVESMEKLTSSSELCNSVESSSDYGNRFSLIRDKIEALLGQPIYKTENPENLFSCCILAASEKVKEVYLNVYCTGSGPAVGDMSGEKSRKAAKALVDYARQAEPTSYAYKAYYLDGPTTLEFGIRDDTPYYNETELRFSEKEFRRLYTRLL